MEHDMTDEDMIGYVLDLLEPGERRSVEHYIQTHPDVAAKVDRVRQRLGVLSVDRDPPEPPSGLALRTLTRVAEYIVEHDPQSLHQEPKSPSPSPADYGLTPVEPATARNVRRPSRRSLPGWLKPDLIVTACIGVVVTGLVFAGIGRTRHHMGVVACEQNLSKLHQTLVGYSDTHEGRFPMVGDEKYPTAGHFSSVLVKENGDPSKAGFVWHDPADANPHPLLKEALRSGWNDEIPNRIQYAYSLGHRSQDGKLLGLRHHGGDGPSGDLQPIAGDLPSKDVAPGPGDFSPHRNGQNILFVGGNVRYSRDANVGVGGDDIYRNREGRVSAGLDPNDCVLGRPVDKP